MPATPATASALTTLKALTSPATLTPPPARAARTESVYPRPLSRPMTPPLPWTGAPARTATAHGASAPTAPQPAADDDTLDRAEQVGWDHARHGVTPPLERLCINPQLQRGFRNGRAVFGPPRDAAARPVQDWLALRLDAVLRGVAFETCALTPGALARLAGATCPVTRERLLTQPGEAAERRWTRARLDAGYASGNVVVLARRAAEARERLVLAASVQRPARDIGSGYEEALQLARRSQAAPEDGARIGELTGPQWWRAALLASYVQPLAHDEAAGLPMLLLPPARLRLFNPVQAWQALVSRAWLSATPNRRLAELREALPRSVLHKAYDAFVQAFHEAWLLEQRAAQGRSADAPAGWVVEDAWRDSTVLHRWKALARGLDRDECLAMVRAVGGLQALELPEPLATEGWALAQQGRLHARPAGLRLVPRLPRRADDAEPMIARPDRRTPGEPSATGATGAAGAAGAASAAGLQRLLFPLRSRG